MSKAVVNMRSVACNTVLTKPPNSIGKLNIGEWQSYESATNLDVHNNNNANKRIKPDLNIASTSTQKHSKNRIPKWSRAPPSRVKQEMLHQNMPKAANKQSVASNTDLTIPYKITVISIRRANVNSDVHNNSNKRIKPDDDASTSTHELANSNKFAEWFRQALPVKQEMLNRDMPCLINQLPNEMLLTIFANLNLPERVRLSTVCHRWMDLQKEMHKNVHKLTLFNPNFAWVHRDYQQLQFFVPIQFSRDYIDDDNGIQCSQITYPNIQFIVSQMPSITELCLYNVAVAEVTHILQLIRRLRLTKLVLAPAATLVPFNWEMFWYNFHLLQHPTMQTLALINVKLPHCEWLATASLPQLRALSLDLLSANVDVTRTSLKDNIIPLLETAHHMESLSFRNFDVAVLFEEMQSAIPKNVQLDRRLQEQMRHLTLQGDANYGSASVHRHQLDHIAARFPNLTHLDLNVCWDVRFGPLVRALKPLTQLTHLRVSCSDSRHHDHGFFDIGIYGTLGGHNYLNELDDPTEIPSLRVLHLDFLREPCVYFYQLALSKAFPNLRELNFQNSGRIFKPCKCKNPKICSEFTTERLVQGYRGGSCVACQMEVGVAFANYFEHLLVVNRNYQCVFDRAKDKLGNMKEFGERLDRWGQSKYQRELIN